MTQVPGEHLSIGNPTAAGKLERDSSSACGSDGVHKKPHVREALCHEPPVRPTLDGRMIGTRHMSAHAVRSDRPIELELGASIWLVRAVKYDSATLRAKLITAPTHASDPGDAT